MGFLLPIGTFLLARLAEPSTWAGLAVLGLHFSSGQVTSLSGIATALAGAVAVFVPESKS
jgi:hypothetical protein